MIWLRDGLVEDRDTDGHSDNIVQFVRPGVVLPQMAPDRSNPNWDGLATTARGSRLRPTRRAASSRSSRCPCCPYAEVAGERYVVPYTNYYPVNGGIVAPLLDHPDDDAGFALPARAVPRARGRRALPAGCWPTAAAASAASPSSCRRARRSRREEVARMIRTGDEYRESIRDGREVWIDGERVRRRHRRTRSSSRSSTRGRASTTWRTRTPTRDVADVRRRRDGERNAIVDASCRARASDWHAKRRAVDAVLDDLGGVVTRVGDETVGEMWSLYDGQDVLNEVDPHVRREHRAPHPARAARGPVPRLGQHRSRRATAPSARRTRTPTCCCTSCARPTTASSCAAPSTRPPRPTPTRPSPSRRSPTGATRSCPTTRSASSSTWARRA